MKRGGGVIGGAHDDGPSFSLLGIGVFLLGGGGGGRDDRALLLPCACGALMCNSIQ